MEHFGVGQAYITYLHERSTSKWRFFLSFKIARQNYGRTHFQRNKNTSTQPDFSEFQRPPCILNLAVVHYADLTQQFLGFAGGWHRELLLATRWNRFINAVFCIQRAFDLNSNFAKLCSNLGGFHLNKSTIICFEFYFRKETFLYSRWVLFNLSSNVASSICLEIYFSKKTLL